MIVSPLNTLNRLAAGHVLDPPASCHLGLPRPFPRVLVAPVPVNGGHHLFEPVHIWQVSAQAHHANNVSRNNAADDRVA